MSSDSTSDILQLLVLFLIPFPVGMNRPIRRTPWATYILIGINIAAYVATTVCSENVNVYKLFGLIPNAPTAITLMTCMFVHVSPPHLFWNMVFLWLVGPYVEDVLGRVAYLALYLGGGIAAELLHCCIAIEAAHLGPAYTSVGTEPYVGASGAISTVIALYAMRFHRDRIRLLWLPSLPFRPPVVFEISAAVGIGIWLLENVIGALRALISPESNGIAYWAHIGGFLFGMVVGGLTGLVAEGRRSYLLDEARTAGREAPSVAEAIAKYRQLLDKDPDNGVARWELAQLYVEKGYASDETEEERRVAASVEWLQAVRSLYRHGHVLRAARCCGEARTHGLKLWLNQKERLDLGLVCERFRDPATAAWLYKAIIADDPDGKEAEIASLKLGQILIQDTPLDAFRLLTNYSRNFPNSPHQRLARQLAATAKARATEMKNVPPLG